MTLTLIFKLAEEVYGLEIDNVQEVVEDPELYYVPWAEGVLCGAINFHGQILSVINLPMLLKFQWMDLDHRRIVLTHEQNSLVLSVCQVERIVKLDLSSMQPPPVEEQDSAIRGIADDNGRIVNILDIEDVIRRLEIEVDS